MITKKIIFLYKAVLKWGLSFLHVTSPQKGAVYFSKGAVYSAEELLYSAEEALQC